MARRSVTPALVVLAFTVLVACSGNSDPPGSEAERFFEAWVDAWSSGDVDEAVRFYDEDVSVSLAQSDPVLEQPAAWIGDATHGEGRSWLAAWLGSQVPSDRVIEGLFAASDTAVATVTIGEFSTAAWVEMKMTDAGIADQGTYRWRHAHLSGGTPDVRLSWVDDFVASYITAWSGQDVSLLESLYVNDAVVDLATGDRIVGRTEIVGSEEAVLPGATIETIATGGRVGPAVFVFPSPETKFIAFVVEAQPDGCPSQVAVSLRIADSKIVSEHRLASLATSRICDPIRLKTEEWWNDLSIPPPLDEQVTGIVTGSDGADITIINGSDELNRLVAWGLRRFADAGLERADIGSITFGPVRTCAGRSGIVSENDGSAPDLVLCTDTYAACIPTRDDCTTFKPSVRFALLHEVAHVWMLDHLTDETRVGYVELTGTSGWRDADTRWHQRGVEHAAETIAWSLMDEPVRLTRIGDPPCTLTTTGFRLLTGREPLNSCTD